MQAYDRWFDQPWGRYAAGVEARALRRSADQLSRALALDGGCGTGRFAAALAPGSATVVGLDLEAGMIALAAPRLAGRAVLGDLERLPFRTGTFELAMAVTVLEFVPDPRAVVAELARVARPGGRLLIGALNSKSSWGLAHRRLLATGPWRRARFLTRRDLVVLGVPYGSATVTASLYAPGWFPGLARQGWLFELAGGLVPAWGGFQVLAVDLALRCTVRSPQPVWRRVPRLVPASALAGPAAIRPRPAGREGGRARRPPGR